MKPAILALLAILVVVALRHREPDRAVAPLRYGRRDYGSCALCGGALDIYNWREGRIAHEVCARHAEQFSRYDPHIDYGQVIPPDDDLQPSDPYPASLLP